MLPIIKTGDVVEKMRGSGALTARVLEAVTEIIKPGVTTMEINDFCEDYIRNKLDAIPGSKGQYNYPYAINTSLNHVICHGMPSNTVRLSNGDILNVDLTVLKNGYYGDSSKMFAIGKIKPFAKRLIDITQQCLYSSIQQVKPGITLGDIGYSIQKIAESHRYSVVQEFCGHGIGAHMHEAPEVAHFGSPNQGLRLKEGMTFTIEPMINLGKATIRQHPDGWTVTTKDRRLSAQWEHTILVTKTGYEILTFRNEETGMIAKST